jgi:hypothetical protein
MPSKNQSGWVPSSPGALNSKKNNKATTPQAIPAPTKIGVEEEEELVDDLLNDTLLEKRQQVGG